MADNDQDRKLPASQRKIKRARGEGQVARSRELGHFGAITAIVALLGALAPTVAHWLAQMLGDGLRFDHELVARPGAMAQRLGELAQHLVLVLVPLFCIMAGVAVAGGMLAGGWNFTLEALSPKFGKFNPLSGIRRLFSLHQLTDTLKSCVLALILGAVGVLYMAQHWMRFAELVSMPLPAALASGGQLVESGLLLICGVLALFALVDVPLQRLMLMRRLRMSLEEVKKENKDIEGNVQVKAKMRARMRQMANRRMLAKVPGADLVVMNPTHYAVALKYDAGSMAAPRVIAKGADLMALKIRDLAREAHVPVLQAPPLARALFAHTELDQEIPARLFSAVAQVLAWVYQLRDAMAAGRGHPVEAPVPDVPPDLDPINDPGAAGQETEQ
jgi:flagellar biosynthetic protein FlhB